MSVHQLTIYKQTCQTLSMRIEVIHQNRKQNGCEIQPFWYKLANMVLMFHIPHRGHCHIVTPRQTLQLFFDKRHPLVKRHTFFLTNVTPLTNVTIFILQMSHLRQMSRFLFYKRHTFFLQSPYQQ